MGEATSSRAMIRRRKYIVDKRFQLGSLFGYGIISFMLAGVAVIFVTYLLLYQYSFEAGVTGSEFGDSNWWQSFFINMFWFALLLILLGSIASVIMTHRIAGPMYRLKKTLREISTGTLDTKLKFRTKDQFHDVADEFNIMLEGLRSRIETERLHAGRIRAELQNVSGLLDQEELTPEVRARLTEKLVWATGEMNALLCGFCAPEQPKGNE